SAPTGSTGSPVETPPIELLTAPTPCRKWPLPAAAGPAAASNAAAVSGRALCNIVAVLIGVLPSSERWWAEAGYRLLGITKTGGWNGIGSRDEKRSRQVAPAAPAAVNRTAVHCMGAAETIQGLGSAARPARGRAGGCPCLARRRRRGAAAG